MGHKTTGLLDMG